MKLNGIRCEVLNVTYESLHLVSIRRAIRLLLNGRAHLLEEHPTLVIHTTDDIYAVPTRIILKRLIKIHTSRTIAQVTRLNLLLRDNYTCQYCGRHASELNTNPEHGSVESLTREHIFPQDKGGTDEWLNLTTACNTCNSKKGNMLLAKSGLSLLNSPRIPTVYELSMKARFYRKHKI